MPPPTIIYYQGVAGSFSFMAAMRVQEELHSQSILHSCESFEDIFIQATENPETVGIIPLENSLAGSVLSNYDLLEKYSVIICGELYLRVNHYLLSRAPDINSISLVSSHPQALQQCSEFITKHKLRTCLAPNTAIAAQQLSQSKDPSEAAIASLACAELYQLPIVAEKIENSPLNFTRFAIIKHSEKVPTLTLGFKCSILIKTAHEPGSLLRSLKILAEERCNLTKIESRPDPHEPFRYTFYVDFECASDLNSTMARLQTSTPYLKMLGCYPAGALP